MTLMPYMYEDMLFDDHAAYVEVMKGNFSLTWRNKETYGTVFIFYKYFII